jgi:membrane protein DedA with SNARE-associated domain
MQIALDFIRAHQAWAPAIVFVLACGESLAFVSLLLPATVILVGAGAMVGASGIAFWPIWTAAVAGAFVGDWISYWLGYRFKDPIGLMWPLSRHPDWLPRGHAIFAKWGAFGVFFGRFFGPLRCVMPIVAGICEMPWLLFQIANFLSAVVWATGVLAPGALAFR